MKVSKCSFCGKKLPPNKGKMYVLNSNVIKYFCSRKCEKSWHMGRNPKKLKWARNN
ncbi:MAG: 50S ribosomal protein L24 [Candidatus Aenigmarchaeota archaeon]|nr:50S ribosomal protein L24 [Candidatus Aenigmarchaeota archaeon]MCX8179402.1 50S ribosomal protein L24 [Candidatus Aenigmarchaeota archaeon]